MRIAVNGSRYVEILPVHAAAMLHLVLHVRWRWDHEPHPARGLSASLDLADGTFKGAVLLPWDGGQWTQRHIDMGNHGNL